ncbi:YkuJ family protein [Oenococcus alcoholitolerans]|uniref:YkuJ family protein n=1 Tax=Oenococcus alcoholitolerans TaxID=931074 RepID=UPI003F6F0AC6
MTKSNSEIEPILNRLNAMVKDNTKEIQVRNFDMYGINLVRVSFDHTKQIFTVKEFRQQQIFEFDNIDLAAIDIYEIMHEMKLTF